MTKQPRKNVILSAAKDLMRSFSRQKLLQDDKKRQSGNAVIFILLAVALFGGLAYTFMRGAKSGQGNLSAGQARLAAQEIINYGQSIDKAVQKLLMRRCSQAEISAKNAKYSAEYNNWQSPADLSCNIFEPAGGGITWWTPPKEWFDDSLKAGAISVIYLEDFKFDPGSCVLGANNKTCSAPDVAPFGDLILKLSYIRKSICDAINKEVGIATIQSNPWPHDAGYNGWWKGVFYNTSMITTATAPNYFPVGCMRATGYEASGHYVFYYVLIPSN